MEKAYVVYIVNSRELQLDDIASEIIGVYSTYSKALEKVKEFIQKEQSNNNYREIGDKREMPNAEYGTVYLNAVYFDGYEDSELYTEVIIECIKIDK